MGAILTRQTIYHDVRVENWILKVMKYVRIIVINHTTQSLALRTLGLGVILPEKRLLSPTSVRDVRKKLAQIVATVCNIIEYNKFTTF